MYDVFLSFRGDDTRNGFLSHLYSALMRSGIYTFKDDKKLKRGAPISRILEAIKDSRISLVVFSKDYAASTWCLKELDQIVECVNTMERFVIPIFYDVDPSDVRRQTGTFEESFKMHEQSVEQVQVQRWRKALATVASVSGWDSRVIRPEAPFIEDIVRDVSDKLVSFATFGVGDLVGIASPVKKLLLRLCRDPDVTRMVGIWGMGGIGKTTTAKVIYNRLTPQFQAHCFLSNVRGTFEKRGPAGLQKELLSEILLERDLKLWPLGKDLDVIKKRLCRTKVFIVLDDVDSLEQLEVLANELDWFGPGSRIIITTRDKSVLDPDRVDIIHEVECLQSEEAVQLFNQRAFKDSQPPRKYLELSKKFISYANGLPLALRILGSFLRGRSLRFWRSELEKLEKYPNVGIQKVLKVSYDGLGHIEKRAFLDIACFFSGRNEDLVMNFLHGCDFKPDSTLEILKDRALITISDNILSMHDLLREMGRGIVREESNYPEERSRLWDSEEISAVLAEDQATKKIEGISLDVSKVSYVLFSFQAFKKMGKLRLLDFCDSQACGNISKIQVPDGLQFLSHELRYLYWHAYPLKSLPASFCPRKLVELRLPYSNIEQLCSKDFKNLKVLDLRYTLLSTISGVSVAQKLESLNLEGCRNMTEVSSIQFLTKLVYVNLSSCENLESLPSMDALSSLVVLNLSNCSNLRLLPQSVGNLSRLTELDLANCIRLENLPSNIQKLESVKFLNIVGCPHLLKLAERPPSDSAIIPLEPPTPGEGCNSDSEDSPLELHSQGQMVISNSEDISSEQHPLQMTIFSTVDAVKDIHFGRPQQTASTSQTYVHGFEQSGPGYTHLMNVMIAEEHWTIRNPSIGQRLVELNLQNLTNLVDLSCIQSLTVIRNLKLEGCSNLRILPFLPLGIENLNIAGTAIEELSLLVGHASSLLKLNFRDCTRLKYLPSGIHKWKLIQIINVAGCSKVLELLSGTGNGKEFTSLIWEEINAPLDELFGGIGKDNNGEEKKRKRTQESSSVSRSEKRHNKGKRKVTCVEELREDSSDSVTRVHSKSAVASEFVELPGFSIPEVMVDLQTLEEVRRNDRLFFFATLLLEEKVKRQIYMSIGNPKDKVQWLKFHYFKGQS